ncbi:MAG: hypothetical protein JRH16_14460 [Deltaproteobacteria bacterium]|nr:hypothetical protein [Deltaproteobacteria bacterium]MBW2361912.1 hypothetical protein [Deltaproteobacteria bacterium]
MTLADSIQWKAVACALGFAAALVGHWLESRGSRRPARALYSGAALLGLLVFFNFGAVRHAHDITYVNQYEQFHYQLGAKYFPELGYDGLYLASVAAERQTLPGSPKPVWIRDLASNRLMALQRDFPVLRKVRERFTPERWAAFRADHAHYLRALSPQLVARARRDHGFNPTPAWAFVARLFAAPLSATPLQLGVLASLDLALMALAFAVVFRSFGTRAVLLCVALFGLCFGPRYMLQGAFLRLDWLAAVLLGVCALRHGRPASAGAALGYAAAVRVFPVVFFAGTVCVGAAQWLRGERPRWPARLVAGFSAALLVAFVGGASAGRGVAAWSEFAKNIELHRTSWAPSRIGLDMLVVHGPEALASAVERRGFPRPAKPARETAEALQRQRRWIGLPFKLVFLGLLAAALWRASPWEGAVLGVVALFSLTSAGAHYWILLCVAPLGRAPPAVLATLAISAPLYALERWEYWGSSLLHMRFVWASFAVALVLLVWLLPDVWKGWREHKRSKRTASAARASMAGLVLRSTP